MHLEKVNIHDPFCSKQCLRTKAPRQALWVKDFKQLAQVQGIANRCRCAAAKLALLQAFITR